MPQRTDTYELAPLGLRSGDGRRLDLHVPIEAFHYAGEPYAVTPDLVPVRLDVSRTTGMGWALRLRFSASLNGPCMRCLEPAEPVFDVDVREVSQPGGGEELSSPYLDGDDVLQLDRWARDALALELPAQLTCREDCAGLCGQCGANLNEDPGHQHDAAPDPRWAKLGDLKFD
jgi:DUF177 domain-containing protein